MTDQHNTDDTGWLPKILRGPAAEDAAFNDAA